MDRCDVLIVGGGPGGSSCARALVRAGLDAVVLDRRSFPRDKVCAGWITPPVLECLEVDPAEYARQGVLQPVHGFAVSRLGDPAARVDYGRAISYGIRRCELDHFLLARAGARLRLGEPLRSLRREGSRWIANDAVEAPILVGAGGHFCPVAQQLGCATGPPAPVVAAQEIEVRLAPEALEKLELDAALPELFFEPDLAGYGWVVRKGDWLNVGLGRQGPRGDTGERSEARGLAAYVARFLARMRSERKVPAVLETRFRGHAYLLHGQAERPLAGDGVVLVGDAAGLAYPRSGEGIRPAVESGLLAARTIADAGGDPARLAPYAERIEARFGPRAPRPTADPSAWLPPAWRRALAGRLLGTPAFARRIVLDRWFLHRDTPALAPV
ncbi:MAG TPA: NAD(P)/FAD-dependent oxidoreductase [Myxococcota bacterium]|nr:NAD(P)/FAD-dependent oxidoreductase [Myxococcota bacterium]